MKQFDISGLRSRKDLPAWTGYTAIDNIKCENKCILHEQILIMRV